MDNLANHLANSDADSRRYPGRGAPIPSDPVSGAMQDGDGAVRAAAGAVPRPVQRRPGKPPGHAKPANSGRRKGVPNKSTKEIKAIAQKQGAKAVRVLVRLMTKSENETTRLKAAVELLDRGYGRPVTPSEISGPDGGPIETNALTGDLTAHEKMRALAAGLRRGLPDASWPAGPGKARPDLTRPIEVEPVAPADDPAWSPPALTR